MAKSRRAQILMEPEIYAKLASISRVEGKSFAALIREAVEDRYSSPADRRREALEDLLSLDIPVADWTDIDDEISEVHDAGIH
jgi:predicted DNA-binding protein